MPPGFDRHLEREHNFASYMRLYMTQPADKSNLSRSDPTRGPQHARVELSFQSGLSKLHVVVNNNQIANFCMERLLVLLPTWLTLKLWK